MAIENFSRSGTHFCFHSKSQFLKANLTCKREVKKEQDDTAVVEVLEGMGTIVVNGSFVKVFNTHGDEKGRARRERKVVEDSRGIIAVKNVKLEGSN